MKKALAREEREKEAEELKKKAAVASAERARGNLPGATPACPLAGNQ